jgi:hypothetical protein
VKKKFKALDSLIVKDDFYSAPDEVRQAALNSSYEKPPSQTNQLAVTTLCKEVETRAMCKLLKPYVRPMKDNGVIRVDVLFRYTLANAQKKIFCHIDGCSAAGIVYLTRPEDCAGGTTIYRHKATGDEIFNLTNARLYDLRDPSQWEIIKEVEMVYNRLVMYPGQLFHAITPIFFGDNIDNARLTQNVFIHRKNDAKMM